MTFTDTDLARLKENLRLAFGDGNMARSLDALIARLEAAEKVLNGSTHIEVDYPEVECEGCKNMEAWRKAKGE